MLWWSYKFERCNIADAESLKVRNSQCARARDVAERVAANVSVVLGVRQFADANTVSTIQIMRSNLGLPDVIAAPNKN